MMWIGYNAKARGSDSLPSPSPPTPQEGATSTRAFAPSSPAHSCDIRMLGDGGINIFRPKLATACVESGDVSHMTSLR